MKPELRTLITDIKAAARIGHAESLWLALDGLLDLPEVAGNPQMSEAFITQAPWLQRWPHVTRFFDLYR